MQQTGFAKYKRLLIIFGLLALAILGYVILDNMEQNVVQSSYNEINLSTSKLEKLSDDKLSLTIPKEYVYDATQEQLNNTANELGYDSIILNEDGTATYTMTDKQYENMIALLKEGTIQSLNDLKNDKKLSEVAKIESNEDFTVYNVTLSTNGTNFKPSDIYYKFRSYSSMFAAFSGQTSYKIEANFYDVNGKHLTTYTFDSSNTNQK